MPCPTTSNGTERAAVPIDVATNTRFQVAENLVERYAAFRLVYKKYVKAALIEPRRFQCRITPFHLSKATNVFVGLHRGRVVCTVTLVQDGELGLPMEQVYGEEVGRMRSDGHSLAEVSCLAFEAVSSKVFWKNFIGLNRLMAQFARFHEVDRLLIAAHPRHARFYERHMGFEQVGEIANYPSVQNRPAVACCLDFRQVDLAPPPPYDDVFAVAIPQQQLRAQPISAAERSYFGPFVSSSESWVPLSAAC